MKQWGLMNQQTKTRASQPRFTFAVLAAVAAVTCAKAEDQALPGATGAGGSNSGGLTGNSAVGTGVQNTTTISTASAATAASASAATTSSGTSTGTSGGGTQGGEAGAPADTGSTGTGDSDGTGTGGVGGDGTGTGGTSTTGVPSDVIENAEVVLLYKIDGAQASTASIFMHLYLRNQSDDDFPLNAAEVRYWLDSDGRNYTMASHYQGPGIGKVTLSKGSEGDDEYVAVTFGATATLAGNTTDLNRNEFQLKLDAAGGNFDQSNDYSFAPTLTSATEHDRVTVYLADELIWGCEPSGTCAGDDPGAGGAAGAAGAEG